MSPISPPWCMSHYLQVTPSRSRTWRSFVEIDGNPYAVRPLPGLTVPTVAAGRGQTKTAALHTNRAVASLGSGTDRQSGYCARPARACS